MMFLCVWFLCCFCMFVFSTCSAVFSASGCVHSAVAQALSSTKKKCFKGMLNIFELG